MDNYFDSEIKYLEQEITRLKTSAQKSAVVLKTVAKSATANVSLSLDDLQVEASGTTNFKVDIDPDSLVMVTLNKYYDDVTKAFDYPRTTREFYYVFKRKTNGDYIVQISAVGTANDVQTLKNGGSVTMTCTVTVRCTNDFTIEAV